MTRHQRSGDPFELLLDLHPDAQKRGDRYVARCRAHADSTPSLSLSRGNDGRALIHCYAGCTPTEVLAAVGLKMRDLFPCSAKAFRNRTPSKAAVEHERLIVAIGISLLAKGEKLPEADLERLDTARGRLAELGSRK